MSMSMSKIIPHEHGQGHLGMDYRGREYFERDGEVYRADMALPVMPDGYRCGRWEGSQSWFDRYYRVVNGRVVSRRQR